MGKAVQACIKTLSHGGDLKADVAREAMRELMTGSSLDSQTGAFLALMTFDRLRSDVVAAFAQEMRDHALHIDNQADPFRDTIDIVGTGGDGQNTFNISTVSALVVAAAGGRIAKHGNRAVTSKTGSADLLEALGANINLGPVPATEVMRRVGFVFLFARTYHPAMRFVAPARGQIGIRSIFNIIGPLSNPCRPRYQVLGVFDKRIGRLFAEVSLHLGIERSLIVHGQEGLDELSIAGPSFVWRVENGEIFEEEVAPEDFGLSRHPLSECASGKPEENVATLKSIIAGEESSVSDFILLNSAAALVTCGIAKDYKHGVEVAREAIKSGKVAALVESYVKESSSITAELEAKENILTKIEKKRRVDVAVREKRTPLLDLAITCLSTPTLLPINSAERILQSSPVAIMAEMKRRSPSKGLIAKGVNPVEQALRYARAGAAVVSCLTEPRHFGGNIEELREIRAAFENLEHRPALLMKDFIVSEYQIYEARAYGADSILLIAASLDDREIATYLRIARSLGMEPFVEVNNEEEMHRVLALDARLIGVNNRDLKTFKVDLNTTGRLAKLIPDDKKAGVVLCAFSGISSRSDVEHFVSCGARACLVGESLMRSENPRRMVQELLGNANDEQKHDDIEAPRVKICGVRDGEAALLAARIGADFIGMIFVPKSKRCVSTEAAKAIIETVRGGCPEAERGDGEGGDHDEASSALGTPSATTPPVSPEAWYASRRDALVTALKLRRPLFVGVFMDQPADEINKIADDVGLDLIQLHGSEGCNIARDLNRPVIRVVHIEDGSGVEVGKEIVRQVYESGANLVTALLLDAKKKGGDHSGGTGISFDWEIAADLGSKVPLFVAGGLSPSNVARAVSSSTPFAVDVSSGVEVGATPLRSGEEALAKCPTKIRDFIYRAKN